MPLMMPSRQAMLPEIVGMDRMMNAVSLSMAGMNSMRLLHTYVDDADRGHVMSVFMTQMAMMQFATFVVGIAADMVGIRVAMASLGVILMAVTALSTVLIPTLRRMD